MPVIFPWIVLGRGKPIQIVSANIFEVSATCSMAVTWYMCLTYHVAFLTMVLSQLKKHVVASKQVRKLLMSKVPSTVISMRSRVLPQEHQTQWEKHPRSSVFFYGNSMIGDEQTGSIKTKWNLTHVVAILWKWPSLFQRWKSSTGSWKVQNSLTTQHVNACL